MQLLEIRQLAKVQVTFANTSAGFSPIIGESLIGEVPDPQKNGASRGIIVPKGYLFAYS